MRAGPVRAGGCDACRSARRDPRAGVFRGGRRAGLRRDPQRPRSGRGEGGAARRRAASPQPRGRAQRGQALPELQPRQAQPRRRPRERRGAGADPSPRAADRRGGRELPARGFEAAGDRLRDAAGDPAGPDLRGEHGLRDARAAGGGSGLGHRRAGLLGADGGRGQGRRGRRAAGAQGRRLGGLHHRHRQRDGRGHGPLSPRPDGRGPEDLRLAAALGDVRAEPHHDARADLRQRRARRDDGADQRGAGARRGLPRGGRHPHGRPRAGDAVRALLQRLPGEGRRRGPRRAHEGEPRCNARGPRPRGRELRRPRLRRPRSRQPRRGRALEAGDPRPHRRAHRRRVGRGLRGGRHAGFGG